MDPDGRRAYLGLIGFWALILVIVLAMGTDDPLMSCDAYSETDEPEWCRRDHWSN